MSCPYFLFISLERLWLHSFLDKHKILSHIYALFVIVLGWGLFAITDLGQLGIFFSRLFSFTGGDDWMFYLRDYAEIFIFGILFSMPILNKIRDALPQKASMPVRIVFSGVVLLLSVAYLVDYSYNPFLYFRF